MVEIMPKPTLMVAPNGARKLKSDHPGVPISIPEIAQTALDCFRAGADALHLHVRTPSGAHSLDPVLYQEAIREVTSATPGMSIQITTESAGIYDVATQLHCLNTLAPAAASIAIREIGRDAALAPKIYGLCNEAGTDVQHILYDTNDIRMLHDWIAKGWIPRHMTSVIFVLGQYQPMVLAQPDDLQAYLEASRDMSLTWAMCAFGKNELACAATALQNGGNIRIGFENNTLLPDGSPATDNIQTVALAAALIKDMTHE
jgi:uncharacterized protein (DUF849 family)